MYTDTGSKISIAGKLVEGLVKRYKRTKIEHRQRTIDCTGVVITKVQGVYGRKREGKKKMKERKKERKGKSGAPDSIQSWGPGPWS